MENNEKLNEIINALKYCDFSDLTEEVFYENVVYFFGEHYHKSFTYETGATKGVLIFSELGFVIKIPFCGYIDEDWLAERQEEEDYDGYDLDDGFCYFEGAESSVSWDYCEAEADKYIAASKQGVEKCFAETKKVTEINGHPIYCQEYAEIYSYSKSQSHHTEEDRHSVEEICKNQPYFCFNLEWLSDVFSYYGEKFFYELMNFIDSERIEDLHGGNVGYVGMRPVLIDYSSWNH